MIAREFVCEIKYNYRSAAAAAAYNFMLRAIQMVKPHIHSKEYISKNQRYRWFFFYLKKGVLLCCILNQTNLCDRHHQQKHLDHVCI